MTYIKNKAGSLFQILQAGPWQGIAPLSVSQIEEPCHRWNGGKRTIAQHQQVLAFFAWSYEHTKAETMAHWLYNDQTHTWCPIVLPQKGYTGMTVRLLPEHENTAASFARGNGGEQMGTDHHHCSGSAFQSGTDRDDEKSKEGLHITIGDLGKATYSIHARASFRQNITPVWLSDWYAVPEEYIHFPESIQTAILHHLLTAPAPEGTEFPEWWKENVIREAPSTGTLWTQGSSHSTDSYHGHRPMGFGAGYRTARDILMDDLETMARRGGYSYEEFLFWIEGLAQDQDMIDLVNAIKYRALDLDDCVSVVKELAEEDKAEDAAAMAADEDEDIGAKPLATLTQEQVDRAYEGYGLFD